MRCMCGLAVLFLVSWTFGFHLRGATEKLGGQVESTPTKNIRRVEIVDQSSDVLAWVASVGFAVQPSRLGSYSDVMLKGMKPESAIISADCPSGRSEMIEDVVTTRLVPADDADNLAEVMRELISSPDEHARLGCAASGV
jgi:glycosyltransferase involved in cell wall biosynthesis